MAWRTRYTITWLLALLLPFQALTAVHLDVRGPAHFHVKSADGGHSHDRGPERDRQSYGHYYVHFHAQNHVERHHHHPGDPGVVTVRDHTSLESFALNEETTSGWSGAMLAALPANDTQPQLPEMAGGLTPRPDLLQKSRFPGPPDRPPRTALA